MLQMFWDDDRLALSTRDGDVITDVFRGWAQSPDASIWIPRGLVFRELIEKRTEVERFMIFPEGRVQFDSRCVFYLLNERNYVRFPNFFCKEIA